MGILDRLGLQIMGWHGPNYEKFTSATAAHLADAGFTATYVRLRRGQLREALDIAHQAGIRLVIAVDELPLWHTPGVVDEGWLGRFAEVITEVREHPALLGYMVVDEPFGAVLEDIGRAWRVWKDMDPEHLFYVNHFTIGQTYQVACSYEDLWERQWQAAPLEFVSADGYPFSLVSEEEWQANTGRGNYFPRHRARMMPHYFEMLDVQRNLAKRWGVKMWAFTFAQGGYSPQTAEGEMRFQLMTGAAYGAQGLQYFSVEAGQMLLCDDGAPTENLRIAKRLNRVLHAWAPTLMGLRSIGVYHNPPDLYATRPLDQFMLGAPTDLCARGDAVVVGHFLDEHRTEHALIVNRTPFEPAVTRFHFGTDETVEECSPADGTWKPVHGRKGRWAELIFAPGQGRLFRFTRPIQATE